MTIFFHLSPLFEHDSSGLMTVFHLSPLSFEQMIFHRNSVCKKYKGKTPLEYEKHTKSMPTINCSAGSEGEPEKFHVEFGAVAMGHKRASVNTFESGFHK
ncbi:hypothetical protein BLX87_10495 [Bacillus sp. VT-16-64]|nr:hypothetical protein BLX87_10495 [Bacillus sp. VT-16-64]